jgi:hypothetical protein
MACGQHRFQVAQIGIHPAQRQIDEACGGFGGGGEIAGTGGADGDDAGVAAVENLADDARFLPKLR